MKVPLTACLLILLATPGAVPLPSGPGLQEEPRNPAEARASLRLPDTDLDLELAWRQIGPDLGRYVEPPEVDARGLHALRVQTLLALGGSLQTDVTVRAGEHRFGKGRYPMGFTVNQSGRPVFFLVDGTVAVTLPSEELVPGWTAPSMLLQLVLVGPQEARLVWHHGDQAGAIELRLGAALR